MLASPGMISRLVVVTFVIGVGSGLMHCVSGRIVDRADPTAMERILNLLTWIVMGLVPYSLGVGLLWLLCGFVFRETAQGNEQIKSWQIRGFQEIKSSLLILGFSFFVAGLPLMPFWWLYPFLNSVRLMFAPWLLVASLYNQSAFAIISFDAFKNFARETNEWGRFYTWTTGMALISFVGSMLMMISWPSVALFTSLPGAMLVTVSTLGFSAAAGEHCDWVVRGTKRHHKRPPAR
jgi:hypothetical protein